MRLRPESGISYKKPCKEEDVEKYLYYIKAFSLLCSQNYIEYFHIPDINYKKVHTRRQFEHSHA